MRKFFSSSLVLLIGTVVGAGLNYAYNLTVNRVLVPADYATFGALLGLVSIISAPMGALQTVAAKYSADFKAEGDMDAVWGFFRQMTMRFLPVGAIFFLLFAVLSNPLASFIARDTSWPIVVAVLVVGGGLLFQLLLPINRGIMQGTQSFKALAWNMIIDGLSRLAIGLLVMLPLLPLANSSLFGSLWRGEVKISSSWAVAAAVSATVFGSLAAYLFSWRPVSGLFQKSSATKTTSFRSILRFIGPTLLMQVALTCLLTIDIILVKRYSLTGGSLTPTNAGEYVAISTLAKMIFYVTGPIVSVMFPMVADLYKRGERHYRILMMAVMSVLAGSGLVIAVFSVAPNTIISLLAPNYLAASSLLVPMTVIFLIYSFINLFACYFLSLRNRWFIWPLVGGSIIEMILVSAYHGTTEMVIKMVTVAQAATLFALIIMYIWSKRRQLADLLVRR